jgi:HEAT repeat protein
MERTSDSIAQLIADLQGADEFARAQAAFALGMLGDPAVEPLIGLLAHHAHDVRMRAAWALGVIGPPALAALLALAESDDPALRIEAIRVLGVIGEGRSLNQLFQALTDDDSRTAQRAATALGKIGDPRAFHPLLTALRHPSPDVRYAVCGALAGMHILDAIPVLEELAHEDTSVTSWGAAVPEAARRAIAEISAAQPSATQAEFSRLSELLARQQTL